MKAIKKIGPGSLAKTLGVLYALMGFVFGIPLLLVSLFVDIGGERALSGIEALLFGVLAPVALAVLYGVLGIIFGFIGAWLYNLSAKWTGGIEIETQFEVRSEEKTGETPSV